MREEYTKSIAKIEDELIALKTASSYTSVKNASYGSMWQVSTGLYRITYDNNNNYICTQGYLGGIGNEWGPPSFRTQSGNTQIMEVVTTTTSGAVQTVPLTLVSNWPIVFVQKIV